MNIMLLISKLESSRGKVISLNTINMSSTHSNKGCGLNIFTKVGRGMKNTHRDFLLLCYLAQFYGDSRLLPPLYKNINPLTFSLLNIAVLFFVSQYS